MAKNKKNSKPAQGPPKHASASESVKMRPRKRTKVEKTSPTQLPKSEEKENMIVTTRPLCLAHFDELYKIWDGDKRIPTVESRRLWAAARNVAPQDVHRFFWRQKAQLKKSRQRIPKDTYDLPVGIPPVIKQEENVPAFKARTRKTCHSTLKTEERDALIKPDAPTSDTLIASPLPKKPNYCTLRLSSPLPPSSPATSSSPAPSDSNTYQQLVFSPTPYMFPATILSDNTPAWCSQGRDGGLHSSFTCVLCTSDTNMQLETPTLGSITISSEMSMSIDASIMTLSALPFLHRSPDLTRRRSALPDSTQWFFDACNK